MKMRTIMAALISAAALSAVPYTANAQSFLDSFKKDLGKLGDVVTGNGTGGNGSSGGDQATSEPRECSADTNAFFDAIGDGVGFLTGALFGADNGEAARDLIGGGGLKLLGCADQREVEKAAVASLNAADGEEKTITTDSGKTVKVTSARTRTETRNMTVVRDARVQPLQNFTADGQYYKLTGNYNLRAGPGTDFPILRTLPKTKDGQRNIVQVMGRLKGSDWIALGANNTLIGYMSETAVETAAVELKKSSGLRVAKKSKEVTGGKETTTVDLDALDRVPQETTSGETVSVIELDAIDVSADDTKVDTTCRTVTVEVEGEQNISDVCKSADGVWELDS